MRRRKFGRRSTRLKNVYFLDKNYLNFELNRHKKLYN